MAVAELLTFSTHYMVFTLNEVGLKFHMIYIITILSNNVIYCYSTSDSDFKYLVIKTCVALNAVKFTERSLIIF